MSKTKKKGETADKADKSINPSEWTVVWKDVNELTPYEKNARINDQTVPYLMNSIKRFGFKVPCVIDEKGVVICGHTRLKAALQLGMARVPCVVADDLSEAEIKAFRLADNKVAEMSSWDYSLLDEEMKELEIDGFGDMADFGFASFDGDTDLGNGGTEGGLPPELAGQDLTPDKLPDAGADAPTCSRIVITFDDDQREGVANLLGIKVTDMPPEKITFSFDEIQKLATASTAEGDTDADLPPVEG